MNEKLKSWLQKAKTGLGKISKTVWIIIAAVIVVIAAAIVIYISTRDYVVLVTGLSNDETSTVLTFLQNQGITDYRLENNDTILVPEGREAELKARLLLEGYPKTGYNFSTYFDNVGALSTEAERNIAYLQALSEKMEAVVRCFPGVRDATVTLTPGTDRTYVLDSSNLASAQASVFVYMRDGTTLSGQQASGIRSLISRAVQGLEISSITILDQYGNTYNSIGTVDETGDATFLKLQLEEEYNNRIRTRILQVLIPLYGEENVRVEVNTLIDVDRRIVDSTDVILPEWSTNGEGIIGRVVYEREIVRGGDETVGGVVGSQVNSDFNEYVEDYVIKGDEERIHSSGQIDYNNSTTTTHVERTAGVLTDCLVSITINSTTAGAVNLETVRSHAAMQAGITGDYIQSKISVVSQPFYVRPSEDVPVQPFLPIPTWALYAALAGLALFLILLVLILILRKKKKKKRRLQQEEQLALERQLQAMLPGQAIQNALPEGGADVMGIQTERSIELRREIRKFVDDNPEIAAQMIRTLLRGGEENA